MESGNYMRSMSGRPAPGCSCQCPSAASGMKPSRGSDFMENRGEFPIGMSYVPWQSWENLYSPEKGLCEGTIFADLNQVFCGKRGSCA